MDQETAKQLLTQVETDYDTIAQQFAEKRSGQWFIVQYLVDQYVQPGQQILDLGCGNGRVADIVNEIKGNYVGMDVSSDLLAIAKQKHPNDNFHVGTMLKTGFEDTVFDVVFLFASFHHIPSLRLRIETLEEISRITKPGGLIIMTNWNLHQWRMLRQRWTTNVQRILRMHHRDKNDLLIPWKDQTGKILAKRYYHAFTKKEMKRLAKITNLTILDQYHESNGMHVPRGKGYNLVTILKK